MSHGAWFSLGSFAPNGVYTFPGGSCAFIYFQEMTRKAVRSGPEEILRCLLEGARRVRLRRVRRVPGPLRQTRACCGPPKEEDRQTPF